MQGAGCRAIGAGEAAARGPLRLSSQRAPTEHEPRAPSQRAPIEQGAGCGAQGHAPRLSSHAPRSSTSQRAPSNARLKVQGDVTSQRQRASQHSRRCHEPTATRVSSRCHITEPICNHVTISHLLAQSICSLSHSAGFTSQNIRYACTHMCMCTYAPCGSRSAGCPDFQSSEMRNQCHLAGRRGCGF